LGCSVTVFGKPVLGVLEFESKVEFDPKHPDVTNNEKMITITAVVNRNKMISHANYY